MEIKPFQWHYPFKQFHINQGWGVYNPAYKEAGLSFTRHNGVDASPHDGRKTWPLYAPFNCRIKDINENNTAGPYIRLESAEMHLFPDGEIAFVQWDMLHMKEKTDLIIGTILKAGDYIGIANNKGFSTGPHTHIQPKRIRYIGTTKYEIDTNEANNSFDCMPYASGLYAEDVKVIRESLIPSLVKLKLILEELVRQYKRA